MTARRGKKLEASPCCNDLVPARPKAEFCDHISFHLLYPKSVILLSVTAIFTGLGLSDYSLKMKKMLTPPTKQFAYSKASFLL